MEQPVASVSGHRFRFSRIGGVEQVVLSRGADLVHLHELDRKLWAALAMPTRGLQLDPRTLDLLDLDKDGRVRAAEVMAAVAWALETFKNPDDLFKGGDSIPLEALREGPVLAGARRILQNLGRTGEKAITLADVSDTARIFAATRMNGDGIVPPESASDPETHRVIEEIISTHGGLPDRSGKLGVDRPRYEAFFQQARAWRDWRVRLDREPALRPLGEATEEAARALAEVEAKIDDYFTRCRLVAFEAQAAAAIAGEPDAIAKACAGIVGPTSEALARLPIARAEAHRPLPLREGINPAWSARLATFVEKALRPLEAMAVSAPGAAPYTPGAETLTEGAWQAAKETLAAHRAWAAAEPATSASKLGLKRLEEILQGASEAHIKALIDEDLALAPENAQIESVEKAVRFQRDLVTLLDNFVSFSQFYRRRGAVFQSGVLYLDGRACDLCVEVTDAAKHGVLATMSSTFLAYCECSRLGEKKSVVAAFTDGDSDNLFVGRNGLFIDRAGRDWDATITKIVAHPISIREAFWSPYKKFVRLIEEQVARRAGAAEAESQAKMAETAEATVHVDKPKKPAPSKIDVGTVAAIGVAIGGIGAMVTGLIGAFLGLGVWMPLGLGSVLLLISGPSMILAYLKLRQRNLGPILDASGWAVNGRAKINVPFGAALTHLAVLPPGAERTLTDPFAERRRPWRAYLTLGILATLGVLWYFGELDPYLPGAAKSTSVLGESAPAYQPLKIEIGGDNKALLPVVPLAPDGGVAR